METYSSGLCVPLIEGDPMLVVDMFKMGDQYS